MTRWLLPDTPDVLGLLRTQTEVTSRGLAAFASWAAGDEARAEDVRRLEHDADDAVRELRRALRTAFTTPIDPEDLYALSWRLDRVLNGAKNLIRESEVMATPPDAALAEMARLVAAGVDHLGAAIAGLGGDSDTAADAADEAVKSRRAIERAYRAAMSALLEVDDLREVMSRRELYRRASRLGDDIVDVAERVWYAVVKEA